MIGTKLAHYEITRHLGTGGMGEVYQANDSRLGRSVAIKLLPEAFTHDHDRASRFEREARVLASLNHPNIAAIYGVEDYAGRKFLVMELVAGETLAERIQRGPIPLDESLGIAMQIAEGLEAAHEKGVIHRDLKPANIKVTPGGKVKVLDFGLAKAFETESSSTSLTNSPTMSVAATQQGMIMGTAAYMSPEQARGQTADVRSDIWSFGCVLYEMLSGRQAFIGETLTDVLARIVTLDPDLSLLPQAVPSDTRSLLRRCLQKDRNRRLHHIADARIEIEATLGRPATDVSGIETARTPASRNRERYAWALAVIALVLLALVALFPIRTTPREEAPELRLDVTTPNTSDPYSLAISSDGRRIVFAASVEGRSILLVRDLDSTAIRPIEGTAGGSFPFWSPDGRSIGFFADGKLKRVDIAGGTPQVLASAPSPRGGTWNAAGTILFGPSVGALYRVASSGVGEATLLAKVDAPFSSFRFPQFLPDGRHFLFYAQGTPSASGVYLGALDDTHPRRLLGADAAAVYQAGGFLLFVRQSVLFAQRFDLSNFEVHGDPVSVADKVTSDPVIYASPLAASASGAIVYRAGSFAMRRLVWFDRSGNELGILGGSDPGAPNSPELSPDEKQVAVYKTVNGIANVWAIETTRGVSTPFTSDQVNHIYPVWSPDGKSIALSAHSNGPYDLFRKLVNGGAPEELILKSAIGSAPADWSSDDRFILYREIDPKIGYDLWAWPLSGEKKPIPIAATAADERDGQFSPDVRWVTYSSDASGRSEIYVQPFPGPGGRVPISDKGGAQPRWRHDQKEIFYIAPDNSMMSVPLKFSANGDSVEPGTSSLLFHTHIFSNVVLGGKQQYAVSKDGQRFLAVVPPEDAGPTPITVLFNWNPPK